MSFQEFVNSYYGWEIDIMDLTEEDEEALMEEYEKAGYSF